MSLVGTLGDLIRKALASEGRAPRQGFYKRSRRQRDKNRVRNARRAERALLRARRPEAYR